MNDEDWKKVEHRLESAYGRAELRADGYKLDLKVQRVGTLNYQIAVFIDGRINGIWLTQDCIERRKFMRPSKRRSMPRKEIARYARSFGKRAAREFEDKFTFTSYSVLWPTFGPLKRHLQKQCDSIELAEPAAEMS